MKKQILSVLLCLLMVMTLFSVTAMAYATNVQVTEPEYYASGALKSLKTNFQWGSAGAKVRLVLMTKKLNGTDAYDGDLTNFGSVYGKHFETFEAVLAYDNNYHSFGIISSSDEKLTSGSNSEIIMNFEEDDIPLNENKMYYVYLWTCWSQYGTPYYYPDNIICAIKVQDGAVQYAKATDLNSYDEEAFNKVVSGTKYNVTVNSVGNMTKTSSSGAETQADLTTAMAPVVYTADEGYYFPEDYRVDTVNGIMVRRDSVNQITVYGTPSGNAAITLAGPTAGQISRISLSQTGTYTFTTTEPHTVTVSNNGTAATGDLTVALSGDHSGKFKITQLTRSNIPVGETATFTVAPKTDDSTTVLSAVTYAADTTYTATVTVSGANVAAQSFDVKFTVTTATTTHTVTWKSQDGTDTLETDDNVAEGAAPAYNGAVPTKPEDDRYTYTFAGWATSANQETGTAVGSLPAVTADVTYYAAFSKTEKTRVPVRETTTIVIGGSETAGAEEGSEPEEENPETGAPVNLLLWAALAAAPCAGVVAGKKKRSGK